MTLEVKHSTVIDGVAYPDDPTKPIGTNDWNATHTLQMASGYLLGRASSGAGAVEELPPGSVATLLSGNMTEWLGDTLSGNVLWRYTPPTTDATAPKFSLSMQDGQWTNGPVGEPSYWNHVAHMGWNWVGGTREDATQAGFGLSFESKFYSGTFGHEFHLQGQDTSGAAHRWLSFFLPHDGGAGSVFSANVDSIFFRTDASEERITMALAGATPRVYVNGGVILQFNTNNLPTIQQMNAAGNGTIALPYIDNFDRVSVNNSKGFFINAVGADAEYGAVLPINISGLANNKAILYAQANAVTGTIRAIAFNALSATDKVTAEIGNTRVNGHAVLEVFTATGTGDPIVAFTAADASMNYSAGVDQSAGKFKISKGYRRLGIGDEDRLVIDDNAVEAKRPLRLPSYTVAGLPSAATAVAGALAYVTNAAGGPTLACSDGTNWRVVAALGAVVS